MCTRSAQIFVERILNPPRVEWARDLARNVRRASAHGTNWIVLAHITWAICRRDYIVRASECATESLRTVSMMMFQYMHIICVLYLLSLLWRAVRRAHTLALMFYECWAVYFGFECIRRVCVCGAHSWICAFLCQADYWKESTTQNDIKCTRSPNPRVLHGGIMVPIYSREVKPKKNARCTLNHNAAFC